MKQEMNELKIVCAANKLADGRIILGIRHWDEIMVTTAIDIYGQDKVPMPEQQGFIDNRGNFLTRTEAWKLAENTGQIIERFDSNDADGGTLYSENLY